MPEPTCWSQDVTEGAPPPAGPAPSTGTKAYARLVRLLRGARPTPPRVRRRDRRGRGPRGPITPPQLPVARTRAERFDDAVVDALNHLEHRWASELAGVQVIVEDVPPETTDQTSREVPLGRVEPSARRRPARLVVYRRPVEARTERRSELEPITRLVVAGLVAELLGIAVEDVDGPDAS